MSEPIRIPLVESVEPRLADSDKDGLASNIFYDKNQAGQIFAVKRPGISSYITGSGQASGVYGWNDQVFVFSDPTLLCNWYLCYGNGRFVAVSGIQDATYDPATQSVTTVGFRSPTTSITSTDGINWQAGSLPDISPTGAYSYSFVAYANGVFAAFCANTRGVSTSQYATSTDGVNWTSRVAPYTAGLLLKAKGANNTFFILESNNNCWTSTNGTSWSARTLPTITNLANCDVCWNGTVYCIVCPQGCVTSSDTVTWTFHSMPAGNWELVEANPGTGLIVALGGNTVAYSSNNGSTWNTVALSNTSIGAPSNNLTFDGTYFITQTLSGMLGFTPQIKYSSNGSTWSTGASITDLTGYIYAHYNVVYGGGKYIIMAGGLPLFSTATGSNFYTLGSNVASYTFETVSTKYYPTIF